MSLKKYKDSFSRFQKSATSLEDVLKRVDLRLAELRVVELHCENQIQLYEGDNDVCVKLFQMLVEIRMKIKEFDDGKKKAVRTQDVTNEFLRANSIELEESQGVVLIEQGVNLYPRIFTSYFAFRLFEELNETLIKCDTTQSTSQDVNFVYSMMHKESEGYVYKRCNPKEFADWLNDIYPNKYGISKIKDDGYTGYTDDKKLSYSLTKERIKQELDDLTSKG